jgi:hypothetical protein
MIGTQVVDAEAAAAAILGGDFDLTGYDAFVERHLGASRGEASAAFVRHFLGAAAEPAQVGLPAPAELRAGDRLPSHVSHE